MSGCCSIPVRVEKIFRGICSIVISASLLRFVFMIFSLLVGRFDSFAHLLYLMLVRIRAFYRSLPRLITICPIDHLLRSDPASTGTLSNWYQMHDQGINYKL